MILSVRLRNFTQNFGFKIVNLDWWPVSRDCLMYGIAVVSLIGVLYDGIVMWYEGLALVLAYFFYIVGKYSGLDKI